MEEGRFFVETNACRGVRNARGEYVRGVLRLIIDEKKIKDVLTHPGELR